MRCGIAGIGAWGPGFNDWNSLATRLAGHGDETPSEFVAPKPERIPPRERRRAPLAVKLAVEVASQACDMAGIEPTDASCVFASALGDMDITDYMCRELASDEQLISPTKFHNSVHNAAVGYWSISTGCQQAGNAVSSWQHTVPASLLEAFVQCRQEGRPVLWVAQDIRAPDAFAGVCDISQPCAFALMLTPEANGEMTLDLEVLDGAPDWPEIESTALSGLYRDNPSARVLPLLTLLARRRPDTATLPLNEHLACHVSRP